LSFGLTLALVAGAGGLASAQTMTTGQLTGDVKDAQGGVLPGATVTAVHTPTGTTYEAVTGGDGRFAFLNVRVGPYTVTARMDSFRDQQFTDVQVKLGEEHALDFVLELASVAETITVTAEASLIDSSKTGTASNVPVEAIEALPTIARSLTDYARLSPYFNQTAQNEGDSFISVAGRNNRYNNVQIDGAVNNDLFGLAASGTPGGQAETQPISLDAIQELQLIVSPYDVRQGGFSGGGVNAITKSGTNQIHGTGYYFGRNQAWVGNGPDDREIATFSDKQFGGSVGGPIVQNRAFYFGNVDFGRKDRPSGFSVDGGSGQTFGNQADVARFLDILSNTYGYDIGSQTGVDPVKEFIRATDNDKVFVRGDFNLASAHQLTVRHNYINANNDVGFPSSGTYIFPDFFYQFKSKTNSTVGQINSVFGNFFNELRVTYQRVRDNRGGPTRFPRVNVRLPNGDNLRAGRENFSTANALDQDIVEITDDLTMVRGSHTYTFGTHNEFFRFRNLFIRDNFGNYDFASLDQFAAGIAGGFDYSYSLTSDPQQAAKFGVHQFGFYVGDQWRVAPRFTLTYGVRVDKPVFPDKPTRNEASEAAFGYRTDVTPNPTMWSPRAGFAWDVKGDGREQVRGGIGLFSGRTPYVWLSNQYGNTGIEFQRLRVSYRSTNAIAFEPDPDRQPTSIGSASTNEIDLVDPDYKFPLVVRGNLAYDRELGFWGLLGTAEFLFTVNQQEILYQNLNLEQAGTRPDGRPFYARPVRSLSDVILLTNTSQGNQWSLAFKVERPFRNGFYINGSYLYGRAKSINDGTSSQAASNWGNVYVPGDPNDPPVATSNFDVRHRLSISGSYDIAMAKGMGLTLSMYYNGQSGRPYGVNFNGDVNGDGRFTNDLFYVPASADEVVLRNGTAADLDAYIRLFGLEEFRGGIAPRNFNRSPWVNTLDFRAAFKLPIQRVSAEITLDMLNLINLFDSNAGLVEYVTFNDDQTIQYRGIDSATGKMIYDMAGFTDPSFQQFVRDDLRSRWQAQLGARIRF